MSFRAEVFTVLFPGFLLIIIGGALMDVEHSVGLTIGTIGFLVLIGWPIFSIVTQVRHGRRVKRALPAAPPESRTYDFVMATKKFTIAIGLPVALFGGLGVFCLVTAVQGWDEPVLRIVAGIGSLLLLVSYLLFFVLGRTSVTLRLIGVALILFGGVVTIAAIAAMQDRVSVGDAIGFVGGLGMFLGGGWLVLTGRNTFRQPSTSVDRR